MSADICDTVTTLIIEYEASEGCWLPDGRGYFDDVQIAMAAVAATPWRVIKITRSVVVASSHDAFGMKRLRHAKKAVPPDERVPSVRSIRMAR